LAHPRQKFTWLWWRSDVTSTYDTSLVRWGHALLICR
jgi:hypothetical protein